jgi:hypothetical protein
LRGTEDIHTRGFRESEVRENHFEETPFELVYGLEAGARLRDVVALLAEEISQVGAKGKVLFGNENCAHACRPMVLMSSAVLVPFDQNGMAPPLWSVQASDGLSAAKPVVQGYDVASEKVVFVFELLYAHYCKVRGERSQAAKWARLCID